MIRLLLPLLLSAAATANAQTFMEDDPLPAFACQFSLRCVEAAPCEAADLTVTMQPFEVEQYEGELSGFADVFTDGFDGPARITGFDGAEITDWSTEIAGQTRQLLRQADNRAILIALNPTPPLSESYLGICTETELAVDAPPEETAP